MSRIVAAAMGLLLLALVEDIEGVENIEAIAASGLLDVLWVGTGDLAMAYGHPGDRDHPQVQAAAELILAACLEHGVAAGYPARSPEEAQWAAEQGYRAIGFAGAFVGGLEAKKRAEEITRLNKSLLEVNGKIKKELQPLINRPGPRGVLSSLFFFF